MPALSIRIALDCFYLLIFYSEKFSTDVCRLPYAVNVNLNLSNISNTTEVNRGAAEQVPLYLLVFRKKILMTKIYCDSSIWPFSQQGNPLTVAVVVVDICSTDHQKNQTPCLGQTRAKLYTLFRTRRTQPYPV